MKNVIQLCHSYYPPFLDIARQYAVSLKKLGYTVTTVYLKGEENAVVTEGSSSDRVIFLNNSSKDIRGLKLKQIAQIRRICKEKQYSFILAHRFKSIYISTHIPDTYVIGVHHCFGDYKRFTRRWHIYRNKKKISLIGVSDAIRDDIRSSLSRLEEHKIHTLYNRINHKLLASKQVDRKVAREYLQLPTDKYIFANVGRLHSDKDQKTLIKAFAEVCEEIPDSILVILGKGELEEDLKKLVSELSLGDRIFLLGMVSHACYYFKAFDSFILSSNKEPFGMVLLEAMTAGLPIAITDCGGAPEVTGDSAFKFSFGDIKELSKILLKLYRLKSSDTSNMALKMRERIINKFTDQASTEILKKILLSIDQ